MIVDHISGDATDNSLNNLRTNCPACDRIRHCGLAGIHGVLEVGISKLSQVEIVKRSHLFYLKNKKNPSIYDIEPKSSLINISPFEVAKLRKQKKDKDMLKDYKGFFTNKHSFKYLNYLIEDKGFVVIGEKDNSKLRQPLKRIEEKVVITTLLNLDITNVNSSILRQPEESKDMDNKTLFDTTNVNLGSIYSNKFESTLSKFLGNLELDKNYKLWFYAYKICSSGYKFRDVIKTDRISILDVNLNCKLDGGLKFENESINIQNLVEKIKNKFSDHDEYLEKENDWRTLGGDFDFIESLDSDIFLDFYKLLAQGVNENYNKEKNSQVK
jgi:hypothetical protein